MGQVSAASNPAIIVLDSQNHKMYKHGKPIYKFSYRPLLAILTGSFVLVGLAYYFIVVKSSTKTTLSNNNKPLVSTVKNADGNTTVDEADFSFNLPGKWKLSAQNWDARYKSWQWQFQDKRYAGRLFMVYEDRIPTNAAYNYMLPVSASGNGLQVGQISTNCTNFTTDQTIVSTNVSGTTAALSKWQGISFLCDYDRQQLQYVGTSSQEGINVVTLTGPTRGTHKYFFLYEDNDISPDLGVAGNILPSFHSK